MQVEINNIALEIYSHLQQFKIAPYVELIGTTYIQASSGYYASIEYSSRGWISGEKNHFKCLIRKNSDSPKEYLYKIEGQWSGKSVITDYKTKVSKPFIDVDKLKQAPRIIKPIDSMGDMETRKIWQKVSEAIRKNDTILAGREKSIIENKRRAEKKERELNGIHWSPIYFSWVENEPTIQKLQNMLSKVTKIKHKPANGNWVFKESLEKKKKSSSSPAMPEATGEEK